MPRLRPPTNGEDKKDPIKAAAEPEIEVIEAEPEVEVEVADPEPQEDATVALKKQIESLQKSEQIHKDRFEQAAKDRDEALDRARQREAQISQVKKEVYESQADAIGSALAAAQTELAKAKLDIKNAIDIGDSSGQAEALERQAIAAANLTRLQEGKAAADERAKQPQENSGGDVIDSWGMPPITTTWLKNHRHLLADPVKLNEIRYWGDQATKAGITPHTKEYLEYVEVKIGEREAPVVEAAEEDPPVTPKKGPTVSAPVSRSVPNSNGKRSTPGKVTLTAKQVEAAKISGITPEEYAKQLLKKEEMVASGEYGEQR